MKSFLIIQTAFIGDVILATSLIEKLNEFYPESRIDMLVRKGNETLLENNPKLRSVLIWDKKENKAANLIQLIRTVRKNKYDHVINLHRFASSGIITWLSGAKNKTGFDKNPFSFCYTKSVKHEIGNGKHETERIQSLIAGITNNIIAAPKLYPSQKDEAVVKPYQQKQYYCVAPSSVWFTKQLPKEKWIELINLLNSSHSVYLLGSPNDYRLCEKIKAANNNCINMAGNLTFLQSAVLMKGSVMNFVNDSAPLHIASAMNAPVRAFFCSTVPEYGFGPLSDNKKAIQTPEKLSCRPCGLHGYKFCPEKHFKCAQSINVADAVS